MEFFQLILDLLFEEGFWGNPRPDGRGLNHNQTFLSSERRLPRLTQPQEILPLCRISRADCVK
jgi:hypothetical protein